jgi:hypothetical protein
MKNAASGMWRHVDIVQTDVSVVLIASIFRVVEKRQIRKRLTSMLRWL